MRSSKARALSMMAVPAPSVSEVENNNVNLHITVKKKILDGKTTVTYTLCDGYDSADLPIEYTDLSSFTEKCLEPALEKARKALS